MKRTYRLVKTYPGSPILGTMVRYDQVNDGYECWNGKTRWVFCNKKTIEDFPEFWQEVKQPLFTTEDGVNYYSDSDYVWDTHNWEERGLACKINPDFLDQTMVERAKKLTNSGRKFFSSREAAEKYIDENKPVFSKKQIRDAFDFDNAKGEIDGLFIIFRDELLKKLGI